MNLLHFDIASWPAEPTRNNVATAPPRYRSLTVNAKGAESTDGQVFEKAKCYNQHKVQTKKPLFKLFEFFRRTPSKSPPQLKSAGELATLSRTRRPTPGNTALITATSGLPGRHEDGCTTRGRSEAAAESRYVQPVAGGG